MELELSTILKDIMVWQASYTWLLLVVLIIFLLWGGFRFFPKSWIMVMFELGFEKAYEFFEEILGKDEKRWIKVYITLMFFLIILSNLLWVLLEFLTPIFWHDIEELVKIPTADINFNVAMAIIWVLIVILEQFKSLGFFKAVHTYFPVKGMDLIPYERWKFPIAIDWFFYILIKIIDIAISLFLGILEIVWHAAKVISLSFRLFWNMTSGWILLAMLILAISGLTMDWFNIDFPVIGPVLIYMQEILVACIQALVFPLLIAIFIKVAKVH